MARNSKVAKKTSSRKPRPSEGKGRLRRGRPKVCRFCADHTVWVDYKDVNVLARFLNDRGRIRSRGSTGTCAQHQRDVAVAIKTARELALLPYTVRAAAADRADRRGGGRRGGDRPPRSAETDVAEGDSEIDTVGVDAVGGEPADDDVDGLDPTTASDSRPSAETPI
jgi:small subunit ribosomal protein S18